MAVELCVIQLSPAVPATVILRDPVLIFPPNVHSREDQCDQHGEAAHQGEDHNALLLRLQEKKRRRTTLTSKV